jgi:hypothetical protein
VLFYAFFTRANHFNVALDETIFREQLDRWWTLAYAVLPKQGPEGIPEDLRCFPALIFQVLAIALQYRPLNCEPRLDELKFSPSHTIVDLSTEYSECGTALANFLGRAKPTFVGVQQSFLRDCWLVNSGDLIRAWDHSGESVK